METQRKILNTLTLTSIVFLTACLYAAIPHIKYLDNLDYAELKDDWPRSAFIRQVAEEYAHNLGIEPPELRVYAGGTFATRAIGYPTQIVLSEDIFSEKIFSDAQVRAILAHELAHGARWDAYRYYTIVDKWHVGMEAEADCLGARLAGEAAMIELFTHHKDLVDRSAKDLADLHPTFEERIATSRRCGWKAKA